MKQKLIRAALPALVLAVLVAACEQPSGGGGGGTPTPTTGGTLTVQNATAKGSVVICDSGMPASQLVFSQVLASATVVGQATSATSYKLNSTSSGTGAFTDTGNFLVILSVSGQNYLKVVSFTNGSGTVDFSTMTKQSDLPAN